MQEIISHSITSKWGKVITIDKSIEQLQAIYTLLLENPSIFIHVIDAKHKNNKKAKKHRLSVEEKMDKPKHVESYSNVRKRKLHHCA